MNILLIAASYPPTISGVATHTYQLAQELSKKHQVSVFTSNHQSKKSAVENDGLVTVYRFPSLSNPLRTTQYLPLPSPIKVRKILKLVSPHIIHFQDVSLNSTSILDYANKNNIPTVATHHFTPEIFTGQLAKTKFTKKITEITNTNKLILASAGKIYNLVNHVTVPSAHITKEISKHTSTALTNIPNFADPDFFHPKLTSSSISRKLNPKKNLIITYAGRVDKEKNLDKLLSSITALLNANENIKFLLIGDGVSLKKLQIKYTNSRIIFTGKIPNHNLAPYLNASHIFTTMSTMENMPISLIEALSCQLPIVAPLSGGIPEIITHGFNGYLSEPNNTSSHSIYLQKLIDNSRLLRKFAKNSLSQSKKFNRSKIVNQHISLYQSLL